VYAIESGRQSAGTIARLPIPYRVFVSVLSDVLGARSVHIVQWRVFHLHIYM